MVECDSTITEVTVYPGQARVMRQGQVELPAGPSEVLLPDLPLSLLPESVRVAGRGVPRARLLGVEVGKIRHVAPPEEALAELDAQIEQLEDEDRALVDQEEATKHRLGMLASLAEAAPERLIRGFTWGKMDLEGVGALLTFVHQAEGEAQGELRRLAVRRRDLARELERLRRLRQDRQKPRTPDRYAVRVPVEVEESGELELEVTYVCQDASWTPLYDLRLEEDEEGSPSIVLGQLAEVAQRTGEDWEGVSLSVSTARPALAACLPELKPWYIDLYRPPPARPRKMMRGAALVGTAAPEPEGFALAAEIEQAEEAVVEDVVEEVEAEVAVAEVREEGAAVVFAAPGSTSIPADGSAHKVFLGAQGLPAHLDWVTAPKVEAHVYRRARVENTTPSVLLQGQAGLFEGDTFIGTTQMSETGPGDEFEIYLGVDDQVKVERKQVERTVDKSGVLEKVRHILFAYRIALRNLHAERIALTVLDQIPVSRNENLKVKLLRSDPEVQPGEMGELRWELALASGEEREIPFAFQVEMPRERRAVGLG